MSPEPAQNPEEYAALRACVESRVRAELEAADAMCPGAELSSRRRGDLLGGVMVVKGAQGPAEAAGKPPVSGPDGDAVRKGLETLGFDPESVFYTLSFEDDCPSLEDRARRLRLQVEAVDAELVVALDREAASDLAGAFGLEALAYGGIVQAVGRRLLAVDGLEAALSDDSAKARAWGQLSAAKPLVPVY